MDIVALAGAVTTVLAPLLPYLLKAGETAAEETGMGMMYRLDDRGHGLVEKWGKDRASQDKAALVFAEHQQQHYTMFDISKEGQTGEPGVKLDRFDPSAEEILAVPRMQAG